MNGRLLDGAVQFAISNENKVDTNLRMAIMKAYDREPNYQVFGPVKSRGRSAGIIIRNGYIVAQWGDVNRVDMTFSVTKSYLSTIAGLGLDEHLISSLDDKVKDYVQDDKFYGVHNEKISWRHLLTQSSDWSGCLFDFCDWADRPPKTGGIDEWKNRPLIEPGSQFEYNDVRVNLLAYSLLQVWRKPLPVVLKDKIMDPIQASTTWRWYGYENSWVNIDGVMTQSVSGGGHFGGGLFINTLDQARFGLLFLRKGKWKSKQLISPQWVEEVHKGSAPNKSYGLMWWTNRALELPGLSPDLYYADGFGGNYIVVDNEHDLVVAVRWLDSSKLGELMKLITNAIQEKK
ncbi:serine hydrolase domain-containing protein [Flavihumibacter fluvii]|uniref:serine hydrolase domain-containing protein n=1 Tax=Flavihumibacter fluvii TaxID=2838157 RepID=UPI001BDEAEF6|nr:serine hydrolase [Flavihumibacter fluvii]ULQ52738.1 beta-lactamase family protein [Flavihumibacter fluvii]